MAAVEKEATATDQLAAAAAAAADAAAAAVHSMAVEKHGAGENREAVMVADRTHANVVGTERNAADANSMLSPKEEEDRNASAVHSECQAALSESTATVKAAALNLCCASTPPPPRALFSHLAADCTTDETGHSYAHPLDQEVDHVVEESVEHVGALHFPLRAVQPEPPSPKV